MDPKSLVGTEVGDYRLKQLLGRGGMGAVFLGWHRHLETAYAVKVLRPDFAEDNQFLKRFFFEAQQGARLKHPNIISVVNAGMATVGEGPRAVQLPFLVMEYVEGQSVREAAKAAGGTLEPLLAARIVAQTLAGLSYAHHAGVIHRDIKPDNLMVDAKGVVRIADFGLAREIGGGNGLTMSGQYLGTPLYMPIEQWRAETDIDGRADIYSLGASFYHLLAGRPPYDAANPAAILHALMATDAVPVTEFVPALDSRLADIVARMMAKDRAHRYASADAVLADLNALLAEHTSDGDEFRPTILAPKPRPMGATGPADRPAIGSGEPTTNWPPASAPPHAPQSAAHASTIEFDSAPHNAATQPVPLGPPPPRPGYIFSVPPPHGPPTRGPSGPVRAAFPSPPPPPFGPHPAQFPLPGMSHSWPPQPLPPRPGRAVAAGVLGLATLIVLPLAPITFLVSLSAAREVKRQPGARGYGCAMFGMIVGGIGCALIFLWLAART